MTPQKYKSLFIVAGLVIVGAIMLRIIFRVDEYKTVSFKQGGLDWAMTDVEWQELDGAYRIDTVLKPYGRGKGTFSVDNARIRSLCGGLLSSLTQIPERPAGVASRKNVYRVTFDIFDNTDKSILPKPVPVAVKNGACQGAVNGLFLHSYPNEMQDWAPFKYEIKKSFSFSVDDDGTHKQSVRQLEVKFRWQGEGKADLSSFPAAKACEYVVADPFSEVRKYIGADADENKRVQKIVMIATKGIDVGFFALGSYGKTEFNLLNGVCVPVGKGDET